MFNRLCLIYGALLTILVISSILVQANAALIGILRSALVTWLLPALLLLPISLLFGRWKVAIPLVLLVLGLVFLYAPFFVPRSQTAISGTPVLKVLTLNIHQPAEREALEEIAAIIRQADADIVALQELGPAPDENLRPLLTDRYPYQALHTDETYPGSGQAVLSKYRIVAEEYWKAGGPWNGNLRVALEMYRQSVIVYNVHPHPPIERCLDPQMESHIRALREVLERAKAEDGVVLLAGDFNMTAQFEAYRWITATYTDAFRAVGEVGFGFTHPHFEQLPVSSFWRVDYIFYGAQFRGLDAWTLPPSSRTDHLPLIARLQLVGP